jgi:hypothetical protein
MEWPPVRYVNCAATPLHPGLCSDHMLIDRGNGSKEPGAKAAKREPRNRWHAVAIVPGATRCQAAEAAKGRRFLSIAAPTLPLRECDVAACTCKYRHHEDRRGAPRRSEEARGGGLRSRTGNVDRRNSRGRRETD